MTELPSKLKIGPLTYKVEETTPKLADGDLIGESVHCESTIRVLSSLSDQQKELVFIHEVVHALLYVTGYPGGGDTEIHTTAEQLTERLAFALYGFLKDNGWWPRTKQ
jgi:ssRNA-specific RNase YbeY (16S rRNA maturation enzyme)